jgi:hypothetical protein
MTNIAYRYGNDLSVEGVIELYNASGLGERRPVDDPGIFDDMLRHANLTVTAWDGDALVGIARTLTDFSYVGYLSDLAVRRSHQKTGNRNRANSEDAGEDGAAVHAGAAVGAAGGGLLSASRIYTTSERVGVAGGRAVSQVAASFEQT